MQSSALDNVQTSKDLLDIKTDAVPSILKIQSQQNGSSINPPAAAGPKKTFKLPPSSALLRAKGFLPQLAKANEDLKEKLKTVPSNSLNIENTEGCKGPIIEMNMAVVEAEEDGSEYEASDSDSEDSSDPDEVQPALLGEVTECNLRLTTAPPGHRPCIEVLEANDQGAETVDGKKNSESDTDKHSPLVSAPQMDTGGQDTVHFQAKMEDT